MDHTRAEAEPMEAEMEGMIAAAMSKMTTKACARGEPFCSNIAPVTDLLRFAVSKYVTHNTRGQKLVRAVAQNLAMGLCGGEVSTSVALSPQCQ